jgi:hypothetical protein
MPGVEHHQHKGLNNREGSLCDLALGTGEWRIAAVGPGVDLGAIVGGEHDDGVLVGAIVLEPIQHNANIVVHLLQRRFFQAEIRLRIAHAAGVCAAPGISGSADGERAKFSAPAT